MERRSARVRPDHHERDRRRRHRPAPATGRRRRARTGASSPSASSTRVDGDARDRRRRAGRGARHRRRPHPLRPPAHLGAAVRHVGAATASRPWSAGNCGFSVAPVPADDRATWPSCSPGSRAWTPARSTGRRGASRRSPSSSPADGTARHQRRHATSATPRCAAGSWATPPTSARPPPTRSSEMAASWRRGDGRRARSGSRRRTRPPTSTAPTGPVPSRLASLDELRGARRGGRAPTVGTRRPTCRLGRRRHHAGRRGAAHRAGAASPDAGDHPGSRRAVEGRRRRPRAGTNAKRFVDEATERGAAVSLAGDVEAVQPHVRPAARHQLYEGALRSTAHVHRGATTDARRRLSPIPAFRDAVRDSVDHPNRDAAPGRTLPPPEWDVLHVDKVDQAARTRSSSAGRSATSPPSGACTPPTRCSTSRVARTSQSEFLWKTETPEWVEAARDRPAPTRT